MIKLSKKTVLFILVVMCIITVLSLREINWEKLLNGEDVYKEISATLAYFLTTVLFFIYHLKNLKEGQK